MSPTTLASTRPGTRPVDESTLLQRTRDGDDRAFAELYTRLRPSAERYARRLVGAADADDVVSEAFAKVLRAIRGGRGPSDQPLHYLMYTVRTTAWLHQRRRTQELDKARRLERPVSLQRDVIRGLDDDLVAALSQLCRRHQQVVWWFEVEGRSPVEVGAELGISANAAAALGYRARRALRAAYDGALAASAS